MKKYYKILSLLIIGAISSCSLLDVETISTITGDGYWKSSGDVDSYLIGIYTKFRDVSNSTAHFEDRGDAFVTGLEGGPSNLWAQNLTSQNGQSWGSYYTVIQHCNMLLKYAPKVDYAISSDRDIAMAETYFIRACMYFNIARTWGDAPIELEPTEGSAKPKLPREPVSEVIEQALDDVDDAILKFGGNDSYIHGKSRASKPAAYALKADILLWKAKVLGGTEQDFRDVVTYADMASKGLTLESDFSKIYDTQNRKGKEVIFAIHFEYMEKEGHYSQSLKPRDIFVEKAVNKDDIPYAKTGARSTYAPSDKLIALFDKNPNDIRKKASVIVAIDNKGNVLGTFDNKMRGTGTPSDRTYECDIIMYRLAEMHLFKAEAYAALGDLPEAVSSLETVRGRAGIGKYTGAMDRISIEKEILDERAREFYLERKRWPDLMRFHSEGVIDIYDEVPNLKAKKDQGIIIPLYCAIPLSDMDRNPNLKQTLGYENL